MHTATFFIATARSGTQWLAQNLGSTYSKELVAAHEPVGYSYRPRAFLRADDRLDELRAQPRVAAHLVEIHEILRTKSYVEVGFPSFALAPLLVDEFGDRLQLVQLMRSPIEVAASLVTHRWYEGKRGDTLERDIELTPFDPGVVQKEYAAHWAELSPFEKALFYWTEVHLFGLEVRDRYPAVPFLTVRFEKIFNPPEELERLAEFLQLPYRDTLAAATRRRVDRYRQKTVESFDWSLAARHRRMVAVAEQLGYQVDPFDPVQARRLSSRYRHSRAAGWTRSVARAAKRRVARAIKR